MDTLGPFEDQILRILALFACPVPFPVIFPDNSRWPTKQKCWGNDGHITEAGLELPVDFASAHHLNNAIYRLLNAGALTIESAGVFQTVPRRGDEESFHQVDVPVAIALVFNAVPLARCLEPLRYGPNMVQMLPLIKAVLPHISKEAMLGHSRNEMSFFLEACLSASRRDSTIFRKAILEVASLLCLTTMDPDYYIERITLRKKTIAALLDEPLAKNKRVDQWLPRGPKWNSLHTEYKICNAQQHLFQDEPAKATASLSRLGLVDYRELSPLELYWNREVIFMKGKIAEYEGEFDVAKLYFSKLKDSPDHLSNIYSNYLVPAMCELGESDEGLRLANASATLLLEKGPLAEIAQERANLTLAFAHIACWLHGRPVLQHDLVQSIQSCDYVLNKLHFAKYTRTRRHMMLSAKFGKAMALHISGSYDDAIAIWRELWDSEEERSSFFEMVYHFTMADLTSTKNGLDMMRHYEIGEKLAKSALRSHVYPFLGTIWLQWVRYRISQYRMPLVSSDSMTFPASNALQSNQANACIT